jgi:hypothetical protein
MKDRIGEEMPRAKGMILQKGMTVVGHHREVTGMEELQF